MALDQTHQPTSTRTYLHQGVNVPPAPEHIHTRECMYESVPEHICTRTYSYVPTCTRWICTSACMLHQFALLSYTRTICTWCTYINTTKPTGLDGLGCVNMHCRIKKYGFPHFLDTQGCVTLSCVCVFAYTSSVTPCVTRVYYTSDRVCVCVVLAVRPALFVSQFLTSSVPPF